MTVFKFAREKPEQLAAMLWATPFSPTNWLEGNFGDTDLEKVTLAIAQSKQFYCGTRNTSTWSGDLSSAPHKPKPKVLKSFTLVSVSNLSFIRLDTAKD